MEYKSGGYMQGSLVYLGWSIKKNPIEGILTK